MSETQWMPASANDFDVAQRQYVEHYGSVTVMNMYLKVAVLCLALANVALAVLNVRTYAAFHHLKPLVIRINQAGQAEAINYGSLEYQPQEAEIKYFLIQFVQQHYGRMRATVQENYTRSLYFVDGRLAEALMQVNKKTKAIEAFIAGQTEEIEIQVKNVALEDLRKAPYKATVEFERVFYTPGTHAEARRERYVAHFVFVVKEHVDNAYIPVNPLGLTITYFRADQAFE